MTTATQNGAMVDAALKLAAVGFRVFPWHTVDGAKKPAVTGWKDRASSDPAKVRAMWERMPSKNPGIATGRGLYVIDADGPAGLAAFAALALPPTMSVRTGRASGGAHFYYRTPAGVRLANASGATIAQGVDGRGDGGWVAGAGSVHASGQRYAVTDDRPMADLPEWLIERLAAREHRDTVTPDADELSAARQAFERLPAGEQAELVDETRERLSRAAVGLAALPVREGNGRGDKIMGHAWSVGECVGAGALDLEDARTAIVGALERDTAALHERSIARGLARGIADPLVAVPECFGVAVPSVPAPERVATVTPQTIGRTAGELLRTVPVEPAWIIPGVLARKWTVKIASREKTGKGTLIALLLGCLERGEATVFGPAVEPVTAVVLTEEPDDSIREKLANADLERSLIVYGWELAALAWPQKVETLVKLAVDGGHGVVFVDNVSRAAGVVDEAGVELSRAVELFSDAIKTAGLAGIIDHHHKKGAGPLGDKSRGGTGTAGATENNVELERIGDWDSRVRRVSSRGRIAATIWTRTIELSADGREYTVLADTDAPQGGEDRRRLEILTEFGEAGATVPEFAGAIGKGDHAARRALQKMLDEGRACAEGSRPVRYVAKGVSDEPVF